MNKYTLWMFEDMGIKSARLYKNVKRKLLNNKKITLIFLICFFSIIFIYKIAIILSPIQVIQPKGYTNSSFLIFKSTGEITLCTQDGYINSETATCTPYANFAK